MLAMQDTTTVPTDQYFSDLPGMRPGHTIRKPVLVEGEYTIFPCDSSRTVLTT